MPARRSASPTTGVVKTMVNDNLASCEIDITPLTLLSLEDGTVLAEASLQQLADEVELHRSRMDTLAGILSTCCEKASTVGEAVRQSGVRNGLFDRLEQAQQALDEHVAMMMGFDPANLSDDQLHEVQREGGRYVELWDKNEPESAKGPFLESLLQKRLSVYSDCRNLLLAHEEEYGLQKWSNISRVKSLEIAE